MAGLGPFAADHLYLAGRRGQLDLGHGPIQRLVGQLHEPLGLEVVDADAGVLQLVVPEVLDGLESQGIDAQPLGEAADDLPIGLGIEGRLLGPVADKELRLQSALAGDDALAGQVGRQGQDHVGMPGRVRPGERDADQKIELFPLLFQGLGIGHGHERIVAETEVGPDRIRITGDDGIIGQVDQARSAVELRVFPAHSVGSLLFRLGKEVDELLQALAAHVLGRIDEGQAALGADGAEQGVDHVRRAADLERIVVAGHHPARMPDHARRGVGKLTSQIPDALGRGAGFGGRPLGAVGLDEFLEPVQAVHELLDIFLVVEVVVNERVNDAEVEGVIGAGADEEEIVGLARADIGADVDDGQLGAPGHAVQGRVDLGHVDGLHDVAGLEDDMLGVAQVVGHHLAAHADDRLRAVLHVARAGGVMVAVVGRTDAAHEGLVKIRKRAAAVGPEHRAGPVLGHDALELVGHVVQGFIPGHCPPFAFPPFADADERSLGFLRILLQGDAGRSTGAQALFERRKFVSLDADSLAVLHIHLDWAAHGAHAADTEH